MVVTVGTNFRGRCADLWQDRLPLLEGISFLTLNCIVMWSSLLHAIRQLLSRLSACLRTCPTQGVVPATGDARPGHASIPQEGAHTALLPQLLTKRGED